MDYLNCFKDMFDSIPEDGKIVLLMFLIKNDVDLLNECEVLKSDINRLCLESEEIMN